MSAFLKTGLFLLLIYIFCFPAIGQTTWVVGSKGGIKWNAAGVPSVVSFPSAHPGLEGTAVYNDKDGNLQFFSEGKFLRNRDWQITPNGSGLLGDISSSQSAVFLDFPNDTNKIILLVVDGWGTVGNPGNPADPNTGLTMSIIDKTLNNGLGDIISGQKNITIKAPIEERIAVCRKPGCAGYWVVVQGCDAENDKFFAYSVGPQGLDANNPVISAVGYPHGSPLGEMEFSPDGSQLAYNAWLDYFVAVFDFNATTGVFSNPRRKNYSQSLGTPYGVEFSPNGQYLFVAANYFNNAIYRLSLPDLTDELELANTFSQGYDYGLLSTGPDGKIYMARRDKSYISCLSTPNNSDPGFVDQAINLNTGNLCTIGLPLTFRALGVPNRTISATNLSNCQVPAAVRFKVNDSTGITNPQWTFGNGNSSTQFNPIHTYSAYGNYLVTFSYTDPKTGCTATRTDSVKLKAPDLPQVLATETRDSCAKISTIRLAIPDSSRFVSFNWQNSFGQSGTRPQFSFQVSSGITSASGQWVDTAGCTFPWSSNIVVSDFPELPDLQLLSENRSSACDSNQTFRFSVADSLRFQTIRYRIRSAEYPGQSLTIPLPPNQNFKVVVTAVTSQGKCFRSDSITVNPTSFRYDSLTIRSRFGLQSCDQLRATLSFRPFNQYTYTWDFGDGFPTVKTVSDTMLVLPYSRSGPKIIHLSAKWNNTCEFHQQFHLDLPNPIIPNLITANGDGKNDAFILPFPEDVSKIEIYNRWGKPVFENLGYKNDWIPEDTTEGAYFFHLQYGNGQGCTGWVQVVK